MKPKSLLFGNLGNIPACYIIKTAEGELIVNILAGINFMSSKEYYGAYCYTVSILLFIFTM